MRNLASVLTGILWLLSGSFDAARAATHTPASCALAEVQAAVNAANPEDTVNVPAGSAIWNGTLTINKGIHLCGAGIGTTLLTRGSSSTLLINYAPTAANAAFNYRWRISGFTLDLAGNGQAVLLSSGNNATLQTRVRVDHNRFYNSQAPGGGIENLGMQGVIDHNVFDTFRSPYRAWGDKGNGQFWWDNFPEVRFGSAENMYLEDNTFVNLGGYMLSDSDTGGRYVFRYNTITVNQGMYPLLDIHGGRGDLYGGFGGEVYGNQINSSSYDVALMSQRGGKLLLFHNNFSNLSRGWNINVYNNDGAPPANHYEAQLIHDSYYFNNRRNFTGSLARATITADVLGTLRENASFWQDAQPFTGASGIGYGPLADRPVTCTPGVGYWATDQTCTDLTGGVGCNPADPIRGTLYQCTAPNTWTAIYTPYTYPHPLTVAALTGRTCYVDKDSLGGPASDANPGTITSPWKTIAKANAAAVAGDTIVIRRGSYAETVSPTASGTSAARITFRAHPGETVTLTGVDYGIQLTARSYITLDGINCEQTRYGYLLLDNSHDVWIENCRFDNCRNEGGWPLGVTFRKSSHHNRIRGCTIGRVGYASSTPDDIGGVMNIGRWEDPADASHYNLIENNVLRYGGHHLIELSSSFNVIRNNYFHNEAWMSGGQFGNRLIVADASPANVRRNVIEGNIFAFSGKPPDDDGSAGVSLRTPHNIIRLNRFHHNDLAGLNIASFDRDGLDPRFNHIYHNVFFHNGYPFAGDVFKPFESGLSLTKFGGNDITNLSIKNNIFWQNRWGQAVSYYYVDKAQQTVANNREEAGDPLFVNDEAAPDPTRPDAFDFRLQAASPCINVGAFLTRTTSAGSGTLIPVEDAGYFSDGFGIVLGDQVQLQGSTQRVRVTAVDYSLNRLTVDQSLTWAAGQGISLPYAGSAPDQGAFEYEGNAGVAATITTQPVSKTVIAGQTATFSVSAGGTTPLAYQWQRNGVNISGATGATYTTPATTSTDNGATFRVIVNNSVGSATSNLATLTVTVPPPPQGQTLFTTQTPATTNNSDGASAHYELGMRFNASTNGQITAIRFWKASSESGTHTGRIWSATGTQLASVTFTAESVSGWQEQALATPLSISANTEYLVSVNTGNTYYVDTVGGLATAIVNGSLSSLVGGNGRYGAAGLYPAQAWNDSNYFRDVRFVATVNNLPPSITSAASATPNPAAVGQAVAFSVAANDPEGATVSYRWNFGDGASATGLTPTHVYASAGAYTATASISDGVNSITSTVSVRIDPQTVTGTGLRGEYYDNKDFTSWKATRIDPTLNFNWGSGSPTFVLADTFSVRWTGQVLPKYSQTYTFYTVSDDGVRLWVNGQLLINNWTNHSAAENRGTIALTAGVRYDIKLEFYENTGNAVARLLWSSASQAKQVIPQSQLYPPSTAAGAVALSEDAETEADAVIDLGSVALNQRLKLRLPLPESLLGGKRLVWQWAEGQNLPTGLKQSRGRLSGRVAAQGVYQFTLLLSATSKAKGEDKEDVITKEDTLVSYRLTAK